MGRFSKSQLSKLSPEQLEAERVAAFEIKNFSRMKTIDEVIAEKQNPKYFNVKPGKKLVTTKRMFENLKIFLPDSLGLNGARFVEPEKACPLPTPDAEEISIQMI